MGSASWSIPSVHVRAWLRIFSVFLQNQAPNPLSMSPSLVFPKHFLLHQHPSTAGVCFEVQTNEFLVKCRQIISGERLPLVTQPLTGSWAWTHRWWGHSPSTQSFVFLFGAGPQLFPAVSALQESAVPTGGYFSLPPLAWCNPPGSGFCGIRGTSRNSHGLFLSQCEF